MSGNDEGVSLNQQLSLRKLIDREEWQRIQDNFSVITEVGLRTLDAQGLLFIPPSGFPRLCEEILTKTSIRNRSLCTSCLPTFLGGRAVVDKNLAFICDTGLHHFITPLKVEGYTLGYIVVGPVVLVMRKPKEEYRIIADNLSLELDDFWSKILEVKVLSFHGAQALVELIKDVAEYTLKLSYENLMHTMHADTYIQTEKTNELLGALLDVAFEISGADIGSVMRYDKANNELSIRVSRGIPEEIVKNTRIKTGDGIAGIVAEEGESVLIDENTKDNRIVQHLKRPYLGSSMVVPLKTQNRVVGVMNLAALSTSSVRFNQDNLSIVNKLADLATLAIQS